MKRRPRWSTSPTIQTAQGRGDIARPMSRSVRSQFSAFSLLSGTSLTLSLSQIRTGSTPWLLVLRPHEIRDGRAPSRSFEPTSSDTDRAESGELGSFFNLIKKTKRKTMETCNKKITLTSSQGKVIMCSNIYFGIYFVLIVAF